MCKLSALLAILLTITGCERLETVFGSGPVGRYQIVTSSQPDGAVSTFILDTRNGIAWRFRENKFWPVPFVDDATASKAALRDAGIEKREQLRAELAGLKIQVGEPLILDDGLNLEPYKAGGRFINSLRDKYGENWKSSMNDAEKIELKELLNATTGSDVQPSSHSH